MKIKTNKKFWINLIILVSTFILFSLLFRNWDTLKSLLTN